MLKTIKGYVIQATDYKENSKILNILTEDGIVGVISKGCKNLKSNLRLISQKLVYAEYVIYYKEKGLSTLKEGTIINNFDNIKKDLKASCYFMYISELASQVMKQNNRKDVFDLFNTAVNKINEGMNPIVITNILEIKYLDYLGTPINLTSCSRCGSKKDIITIDPDEGGLICKECYTNEMIYDLKVVKMLRNYYVVNLESISSLKISEVLIEQINNIINIFYERYTGLYIHSKKFLDKLDSLNLK